MTVQSFGSDRATLLRHADGLIELRRFDNALEALAPLLAVDDPEALCRGALALLRASRYEQAGDMAERAVAANPQLSWPYRIHSLALLAQSRQSRGHLRRELLEAARRSSGEAVRLAPNEAKAYQVDAEVQMQAGDSWGARRSVNRAVELAPRSAAAWVTCSYVYLGVQENQIAEKAARKALELEPTNSAAWNNLGAARGRQGRGGEAAAAFLRAARTDPQATFAKSNLLRLGRALAWFLLTGTLIPVALAPWGAAVYSGTVIGLSLVFARWGPLHARAETARLRMAMRVARGPAESLLARLPVAALLYVLTAVAIGGGIGLGITDSPAPVLVVSGLVTWYWYLACLLISSRRSRRTN